MASPRDYFSDDNPYGLDDFENTMVRQGNPTPQQPFGPVKPPAPPVDLSYSGGLEYAPGPPDGWAPAFINTAPASTWKPGDAGTYQPGSPNDPNKGGTNNPPPPPTVSYPPPAPRPSAPYVVGQGVSGQGTVFGDSNPLTADQNALFAMLMGRAKQSLDVSPDDPIISRQTGAFSAAQQRAQRDYESKLAESAGPNTNIGAEKRFGAERVGQNTSAFQATMMGQELAARRNEIAGALSGAQGMLTAEQQMRLQEELAQLSLAQSAYQFDTNQQYLNSPLGS